MMAVRTDCSASSGRTMMAGGGWRPMRCSAASTSAMVARRPRSDWRSDALAVVQRLQPPFGFGDPLFGVAQPRGAVDQRLVELAAVLADGLDLVLELGLSLGGLLLLGADRFELLVALAQRVERGLGVEPGLRCRSEPRPTMAASARDESVNRSDALIGEK